MYAQCRNIGEPNNLKVYGSDTAKGHKQDRSPMHEGGEH